MRLKNLSPTWNIINPLSLPTISLAINSVSVFILFCSVHLPSILYTFMMSPASAVINHPSDRSFTLILPFSISLTDVSLPFTSMIQPLSVAMEVKELGASLMPATYIYIRWKLSVNWCKSYPICQQLIHCFVNLRYSTSVILLFSWMLWHCPSYRFPSTWDISQFQPYLHSYC